MSVTAGFIGAGGGPTAVDTTHGEPVTQGYATTDSALGFGRVGAPGIGVTVATIAAGSLPAGVYEVVVVGGVGGTVAALDFGNMRLKRAATDLSDVGEPTNATEAVTRFPRVTLSGAQALTVYAVVAATAGSVYHAAIVATLLDS